MQLLAPNAAVRGSISTANAVSGPERLLFRRAGESRIFRREYRTSLETPLPRAK
jgi:hypothetical protein